MKKFFLRMVLLFAPFVLPIMLLNNIYKNTNYWKHENFVYKFKSMPYSIELGNVGNSMYQSNILYSFVKDRGYVTFNAGLGAQWDINNYEILQQYINHFKKGAVVVLPIAYGNIRYCYKSTPPDQIPRYYRVLRKKYFPEWKLSEWIKYDFMPIFSAENFIYKIFHDMESYGIDEEKRLGEEQIYKDLQSLKDNAKTVYNGWNQSSIFKNGRYESFSVGSNEARDIIEWNVDLLCKMISICYEHELVPVLVTTPYTDVLTQTFEENDISFFDDFYYFSEEAKRRFPDILYLDYSRDERFAPRHELFKDNLHMTGLGAKLFTIILVDDLEKYGLLQSK